MIAIIGAGLAGLRAALTLQEFGLDVCIYEASERPGGRLTTDLVDGYRLDRGFQLINSHYPEITRLGIMDEIDFISAPRKIQVSFSNHMVTIGDPRTNPFSVFDSRTGSLLEKASFLRYLATKPKATESVEEHFARVGTGKFYKKVLKPFLLGVYLTDPSKVSAVTGQKIIKTFISGNPGIPRNGVGEFSQALAKRVRDIRFNSPISSLHEIKADAIIVSTDVTTAAQLLDISEIPALAGSTTWYHSTTEPPTNQASLIIDAESRGPVANSLVISNLSPTYAPSGHHLISSTTISNSSESEVRRHLSQMYGQSNAHWELVAKYEIPKALPIFGTHPASITSSRVREKIYVAGDWTSAPSQNGALSSGRLAAELLIYQSI